MKCPSQGDLGLVVKIPRALFQAQKKILIWIVAFVELDE